MKQFQFRYNGAAALGRELRKIRQWSRSRMTSAAVFQIFTAVMDPEQIRKICGRISEEIPEALYMGCSSNGNILEGTLESDNICIPVRCLNMPPHR